MIAVDLRPGERVRGGTSNRGNRRVGMPVDEADLSAEFASPFVLSSVLSVRQRRK